MSDSPPFSPSDCTQDRHHQCVERALSAAEQLCTAQGARLTALRRRVLELVWASHRPLGAYDILASLSEEDGRRAAPPTVYRALDFLLEQGLVHRLASLNAFIGCPCPGEPHQGQFFICRHCQATLELQLPSIEQAIDAGIAGCGFSAERQTVEVLGLCAGCRGLA